MSNGNYSDDPLEDSLIRDDIMRMQQETDEEIRQYELEHGTDRKASVAAAVSIFVMMALFFLWFFFG